MSDTDPPRDFLSLPPREYPSEDELGDLSPNPVRPALETLFSEFARRHRSMSASTQSSPRSTHGQTRSSQERRTKPPAVDLHALEYASEYDSHLMCPICHLPFVSPVVLDCDHTFCALCFEQYKLGANANEPARCPSCRSYLLSDPRKASRLIYNMCNDLKVQCPNEPCTTQIARGHVEGHVARDCLEQQLVCPDSKCVQRTKRKNYVLGQCIHKTHLECDCGAVIQLGRGDWLKHKDGNCPNTGAPCEKCGERMSINDFLSRDRNHICASPSVEPSCPGAEFGCTTHVSEDDLANHIAVCGLARLASHLKSQSQLLQSLQDQLTTSKLRNETLEVEVDHLNHVLTSVVQPRLDQLPIASSSSDTLHDDPDHDVEEIPRDAIPSAAAIHHRDLLLPAHVRDLTPSPEFLASQNSLGDGHGHYHPSSLSAHNHLLALHEALRHTVTGLEADVNTLHNTIAELDARTSMQLMNETLRIKEELAHTNAAMFSNRSQVQWLLNRERIGREQAIMRERERGRVGGGGGGGGGNIGVQLGGGGAGGPSAGQTMQRQMSNEGPGFGPAGMASPGAGMQQHQQYESFPFHSTNATSGSGQSSTATSPMFTGVGMANGSAGSTRRPSMRGGSQERVKL